MINVRVCQWGFSEWWVVLSSIFFSRKKAPKSLENRLSSVFQRDVLVFNSGRTAIGLCLQFLRQTHKDKTEVIIPKYICTSVIEVVEKNGFTAVLANVNEDLNLDITSVSSLISVKTAAVIAPHMYSCSAKIAELESLADQHNVFLIDDAAQVFGVESFKQSLGTFGNAGILSFAQAKSIVTGIKGSGGALILSDPKLKTFVQGELEKLDRQQAHFSRFIEFVWVYKWQGMFKHMHYYLGRLKSLCKLNAKYDYYLPRKIAYVDAALASCQLSTFEHRKKSIQSKLNIYRHELSNFTSVSLPQLKIEDQYLSRLLIKLTTISPREFSAYMQREGVATKLAYLDGSRLNDGEADSGLIELPLQDISVKNVKHICQVIKKYNYLAPSKLQQESINVRR
ncbi:DegT/DnrJ/EryC1/StrS family aminotransferase [Colwelliaceae bacterium 6441]